MSTSGSHHYHAFSLHWISEGLPIAELPGAQSNTLEATPSASIAIREEDPQHWPELAAGAHDTPFLQMGRGDLRLTVEGIGRSESATRIRSPGKGLMEPSAIKTCAPSSWAPPWGPC